MKRYALVTFALSTIILFSSCGEYETIEYNNQIRKRVDSLFYSQLDSLKRYSDSICDLTQQRYIDAAVDSLKPIRMKEIESLLDK